LAAFDAAIGLSGEGLARSLRPLIVELGLFYGLWHLVHLGSVLWILHWPASTDKSRFIIGCILSWAIGMVLAYIFSSAGPIFTGRFDPALAPESVRRVTQFLWANYLQGTAILGGGISAFPSMHVALAVWFALALQSRGLGWLGWCYAFGVFACSVILGWHYSLDGVAGAAVAMAADRIAQAWLRRHRAGAAAAGQPAVAAR
jgi:membrane-associated phospholipid phosphatase